MSQPLLDKDGNPITNESGAPMDTNGGVYIGPPAPGKTGPLVRQAIDNALPVAGIVDGLAGGLQQIQPAIRGIAGTDAKPDQGGADDSIFPGTQGDMGANDDTQDGMKARMLMDLDSMGQGPKAPAAFYAPAHTEFSGVGGRRGEELFNKAYGDGPEDGPTKLANAVRESQKAQEQRAGELSKSYDQESQRATQAMAARRMSMQQDQAELQQRQQNLQMASQQYTNDLADQGKFWTNPGNIIAAISFSLMPIFSNDPAVGVKLVNQAIQQDLDNRRQNAQGALGALRSNLDGYYKLAGDRQAGDQLAEAEAHRIAALDVERIMAKFESPISKAKGEAIIQDLNIKNAQGYMQAFSQAKIFQQAQKQDPALYSLRTQGYQGAFTPINGETAPVQSVGAAVNGNVNGSPSLAPTGPDGQAGVSFSKSVPPNVAMVVRAGAPASTAARLAVEGRIPDSADLHTLYNTYLNRMAAADSKGGGPAAFDASKKKILFEADKELGATASNLLGGAASSIAGRRASLQDVIASANIIRVSEEMHGRDPKDFLGSMRAVPGMEGIAQRWEQLERTFQSRDGLSPAAAREQVRKQAVAQFRQKVAMQLTADYHDISGGAISPSELPRLQAFVDSGSDFNFVYSWLRNRSVAIQDKEKAAVAGLSPIAQMKYLATTGVGQRPSALPVRAVAGPRKPVQGTGEVNNDTSTSSSGSRPYSGTINGKTGSDH